jgi:hypothetical protein
MRRRPSRSTARLARIHLTALAGVLGEPRQPSLDRAVRHIAGSKRQQWRCTATLRPGRERGAKQQLAPRPRRSIRPVPRRNRPGWRQRRQRPAPVGPQFDREPRTRQPNQRRRRCRTDPHPTHPSAKRSNGPAPERSGPWGQGLRITPGWGRNEHRLQRRASASDDRCVLPGRQGPVTAGSSRAG